ncbi:MAG: hypothetical protein EA417_02425 [Gammaproteobacteria bacterium]|nr:MAG: hypothetical protein EA417_02425 [Gammaproteobacteria bacterium]
MKLLLDENISPKLVRLLEDIYPSAEHVRDLGLSGESDQIIWKYAQEHGHLLVSKDDDFRQRSFLHGAPPKVVWLQVGNAGTGAIATLLRTSSKRLRDFESEAESALLILSSSPP